MRRNEYGPSGFWWERITTTGTLVVPGQAPEEPLVPQGPMPRDTEAQAMILCMRHRRRASECGCGIGEGM